MATVASAFRFLSGCVDQDGAEPKHDARSGRPTWRETGPPCSRPQQNGTREQLLHTAHRRAGRCLEEALHERRHQTTVWFQLICQTLLNIV
ncbi:hypothetical protein BaRGS_00002513 [Batillaria attramentaria]|uniref:Uncharacterized protein n=1 Tax=Batillaria attramentaria TaxID=370345 RepID=A0ABD0M4X7_9CAEN